MPSRNKLIAVLWTAREYLGREDNDYSWSSWRDNEHALSEIGYHLERLRAGLDPSGLDILFLPTGPMQEVGLSSGWGDEFAELANRYEDALAEACGCYDSTESLTGEFSELGMDDNFAEISLGRCRSCGQHWLRYYYVVEGISGSGRWFMGAVDKSVGAEDAKGVLESLPYYVCGGSYFDGKTGIDVGRLPL